MEPWLPRIRVKGLLQQFFCARKVIATFVIVSESKGYKRAARICFESLFQCLKNPSGVLKDISELRFGIQQIRMARGKL